MLDLCSGHVQSGETPTLACLRELQEEVGLKDDNISSFQKLGEVDIDYTTLQLGDNVHNMKCLTTVFATKVRDISQLVIDKEEVEKIAFLDYFSAVGFIQYGMTRIPYDDSNKQQYQEIFSKLSDYIHENNKDMNIGQK